jgi:hypothetical protein
VKASSESAVNPGVGLTVEVFYSDKLATVMAGLPTETRQHYELSRTDEPVLSGTFIRIAEREGMTTTSPIVLGIGEYP